MLFSHDGLNSEYCFFAINQVFSKAAKHGEKRIFISGKNELIPRNLKSKQVINQELKVLDKTLFSYQ